MPIKFWKRISREEKFKNPWWHYIIDICKLPNGVEHEYHFVHTAGSVFIIPIREDGKLLMVNQYRYLNNKLSLEFPGGGVKEGQNPDEVAEKELIEETGFTGELEKVGFFGPFNGVTDEICNVYIARNLKPSDKHKKDDTEEFEIRFYSKEEIEKMIDSNEIYDGMTLAAWSLVRNIL